MVVVVVVVVGLTQGADEHASEHGPLAVLRKERRVQSVPPGGEVVLLMVRKHLTWDLLCALLLP